MSRMNSNEEERINNLKKLHIGKLKAHEPLNEELLKEYFQQFGEVVNLNIPKENQSKQAEGETAPLKGYGFVEFASLEAAKKCVRTKTQTFGEKELHVHRSIPRELLYILNDARSEGDVKVFLRNKENFTEKQLTDFFTDHPMLPMEPTKITFPKDSQDKVKGFAIMEFTHEDDCICLVTVGKLKIEKEGGQHKELHPAFYVKNNNRRFRGGYGSGYNNYGRGGWNQGYGGYGYGYDGYDYYCDYDDYGYYGGYGGYGNYGGYEPNYGPYSGGGYGRRYGGGGGRPYPGSGGGGGGGSGGSSSGRGNRRGGDYA